MGRTTTISWTDHTFNPWIGCTKVSPGCTNCYAAAYDKRQLLEKRSHWGPGAPRLLQSDSYWRKPYDWNRAAARDRVRRRVFCASLADVFDAEAPEGALDRLWGVIRETPNLNWLLLTKRPERIRASLPPDWGHGWPNVWLGTSVEDQARADERIPHLVNVPAAVRFLSCEPLLGPVDLSAWLRRPGGAPSCWTPRIHWIIAGGESGPRARPMHPAWVRSLRDECVATGVAFHVKQWGEWAPGLIGQRSALFREVRRIEIDGSDSGIDGLPSEPARNAVLVFRVGKRAAGRELDGRTWDEYPMTAQEAIA